MTSSVAPKSPARLLSLDVFRGVVIFCMLIVNNLGDYATTGYFWKHADWIDGSQAQAYAAWWQSLASAPWHAFFTQFPLWRHCALADYVMPWFMLCIGIAMPFSVAASQAKGIVGPSMWARTVKRAFMLVLLGWILCYFRDQFAKWLYGPAGTPFTVNLGMDVLQLLGVAYLFSRLLFDLPVGQRTVVALLLFFVHWAILRTAYQGPDVPIGTFTAKNNAIGYINANWALFRGFDPLGFTPLAGHVTMGFASTLSSVPAIATMLLGSVFGSLLLRSDISSRTKIKRAMVFGAALALAGFLVGFDITFNKPRWSPSYLLWTTGIGILLSSLIYWHLDARSRTADEPTPTWTHFFNVMGANSIAAYFVTILAKVLLMNTPRVDLSSAILQQGVKWLWFAVLVATAGLVARRMVSLWKLPQYRPVVATGLAAAALMLGFYAVGFVLTPITVADKTSYTSVTNFTGLLLKEAPLALLKPVLADSAGVWSKWIGGWTFTAWFFAASWLLLDAAYRRKIFWKV